MYASTRNNEKQYSTFEVITGIMPNDGGNIVPSSIRSVSKDELTELENCDFTEITAFTLKKFFPDLTSKECLSLAEKAAKSASQMTGDDKSQAPNLFGQDISSVVYLSEDEAVLEANKGATSCSTDYASNILVTYIAQNREFFNKKNIEIVTDETSFFCSLCETSCTRFGINVVFTGSRKTSDYYENAKLSYAEKQGGQVLESYDCAREYIEKNKSDETFFVYMGTNNFLNTVTNFAFLLSAYVDMIAGGMTTDDGKLNISLPSESSGLALAACLIKKSTEAIDKIIICDKEKGALKEFFDKGIIFPDSNRLPPEFETLYFELTGRNSDKTSEIFSKLEKGETVNENGIRFITKDYYVYDFYEDGTLEAIAEFFDEFGYVFDYRSAKGVAAANDYFDLTEDETPILYAALDEPLFSPCKVYLAIDESDVKVPFIAQKRLIEETGEPVTKYVEEVSGEAKRFQANKKSGDDCPLVN
ncbi:MAG: hypothetical protein MRZ91_00210 [Christensenellaceae bacterium]|nr:hypothetical protein [Christensenellaceae bacterium]